MGKWRNRSRILAAGLAGILVLGGAPSAVADLGADETVVPLPPARPPKPVLKVRRGVHVPPGILARVPSGASPGGVRLRTVYPPYPVGFAADPYFTPPAVLIVPPPIVFAPPYDPEPFYRPWWGPPY